MFRIAAVLLNVFAASAGVVTIDLPGTSTSRFVHGIVATAADSVTFQSTFGSLSYADGGPMKNGIKAWGDRSYTYQSVTSPMLGETLYRPNIHKDIPLGTQISITVTSSVPVTVYVMTEDENRSGGMNRLLSEGWTSIANSMYWEFTNGHQYGTNIYALTVLTTTCSTGVSHDGIGGVDGGVAVTGDTFNSFGTIYNQFPSFMTVNTMMGHEIPRPFPALNTLEVTCCQSDGKCLFVIALYQCDACTGPKPFGLHHQLRLEGWKSSACSPRFDDGIATVSFAKEIDATGGDVTLRYQSDFDEQFTVYHNVGHSLDDDYCHVPHGPIIPGPGCGVRCPAAPSLPIPMVISSTP